jgi:hypothetical protein
MIKWIVPLLLLGASQPSLAAAPIAGKWEGEAASDLWPTFLRIEITDAEPRAVTMYVLGQTVELGSAKDAQSFDTVVGEGAEALRVAGHVQGAHLIGTMSQLGKTFVFKLQRIPEYSPTSDRLVGWSRDLDAIRDRLLVFDRSFDAAEKNRTKAATERLRSELPRLSDDAIRVRIAAIAALANNAHTRLYLLRNRTEVTRMPIRAWWFGRDFRVVRASPEYARYLGCRIDRIGPLSARAAKTRVTPLFAGSPTWQTYMSSYSLTSPEVLRGLGIVDGSAQVAYDFGDCADAAARVPVHPLPLTKSGKALESWWDLAPSYAGPADGWKQLLGVSHTAVPLYLRHPESNYWFDQVGLGGVFYIQYNRAADAADESMEKFATRAGDAITAGHARAVVVDLRFNTGGNGSLTPALVKAVDRALATTPLYVIVSRSTFSAGIVAAAQLREARKVKIVGEPVGDGLDFWAEGGNIILPYSGLYVHFANGAHSLSPKPCPTRDYCDDLSVASLAPDIAAPLDWASYRAGRDPAMEAIARDLRRTASLS